MPQMKNKMKPLVFFLLFICNISYSQKIDKSDFAIQLHPLDSLAPASFIFSKIKVEYKLFDRIELVIKYHERIRIHSADGLEYANYEIDLFNENDDVEYLRTVKAVTYNLEDDKIVKSKLKRKNIKEDEVSENHSISRFTLNNVKVGSIIDITYEIVSPFIFSTPNFYFQHYIPVDYASYKISVPNSIGLTPVFKGNADFERIENNIKKKRRTEVTYIARNQKSIQQDNYVLNENDYRASLKYEVVSVSWMGPEDVDFFISWGAVGANLFKTYKFEEFPQIDTVLAAGFLEKIVSESPLTRSKLIYEYVRTTYNWNGGKGKYPESGLKNFGKTKTGNIADVNLLLTDLLLRSGIDAHPFLIKSRNDGIIKETYPSLSQLNYVTTIIFIDDKAIVLDASSKDHPFGMLPLRANSHNGLIVLEEKSKIIRVANDNKYLSLRLAEYNIDLEEGCLNGEGDVSLNDFASVKHRIKIKGLDEDDQNIEDSKIVIGSPNVDDVMFFIQVSNLESLYNNIKYTFTEKKFEAIGFNGDQIIISADLDLGLAKNPFIEKTRENPIFYNNKVDLRTVSFIKIPEDYIIKSFPEKLILALPEGNGRYIYETEFLDLEDKENQLKIITTFKINKDFFLPIEYSGLHEFYKLIFEKQNEKIILNKK